jgi:N-acyl-L-homoserine lactone synthetase
MPPSGRAASADLRVVRIDLDDDLCRDRYLAFRTDFFGRRLGWKVIGSHGLDYDDIDRASIHYGLSQPDGEIVGSIRVTPSGSGRWMIDDAPFAGIIDASRDPAYPRALSAEVSRLGVHPDFADAVDHCGRTPAQALRRAAYQHSVRTGIRYWYVVAYRALIVALRRFDHLPFKTISPAVRLDRLGDTCVACLDLEAARASMKRAAPDFYDWNNRGLDVSRRPLPAALGASCRR